MVFLAGGWLKEAINEATACCDGCVLALVFVNDNNDDEVRVETSHAKLKFLFMYSGVDVLPLSFLLV